MIDGPAIRCEECDRIDPHTHPPKPKVRIPASIKYSLDPRFFKQPTKRLGELRKEPKCPTAQQTSAAWRKEVERLESLLQEHHICPTCGKQLSEVEWKSVHTCFRGKDKP